MIYSKKNSYKLSQQISTAFFMELDAVVFDKDNMTKEQRAFVNTLDLVRIN